MHQLRLTRTPANSNIFRSLSQFELAGDYRILNIYYIFYKPTKYIFSRKDFRRKDQLLWGMGVQRGMEGDRGGVRYVGRRHTLWWGAVVLYLIWLNFSIYWFLTYCPMDIHCSYLKSCCHHDIIFIYDNTTRYNIYETCTNLLRYAMRSVHL